MLRQSLQRWLCPKRLADFRRRLSHNDAQRGWQLERLEERDVPAVGAVMSLEDLGITITPFDVGDGTWFLTNDLLPNDPRLITPHNLNAADTTNADQLWNGGGLGLNLDGKGVTVGVWDGGAVRSTHQELTGRVTIVDGASPADHATHVGGTIGATGVSGPARGMANQVQIRSYDWTNDTTEMSAAAATIQLSNHSYGSIRGWAFYNWGGSVGVADSWFADRTVYATEDPGFGSYDASAQTLDQVLFNNPTLLSVWSAGNDRNNVFTNYRGDSKYVTYLSGGGGGPGWYLVTNSGATSAPGGDGNNGTGYDSLPFVPKNNLTVGAINDITADPYTNADVTMTSFSSWGPADDGRVKPDIVANGASLTSSFSTSDTAYGIMSGTSMAAPNATGTLALLVQHYRNLYGAGINPLSATIKGLAIHSAFDAGNKGPDYVYGWGVLDAAAAAAFLTNTTNPFS